MMDVLPPAGMMDVVHPALPPPPADGSPALSAGQPGLGAGQPGPPAAPPPIPPGQPFGAPTEFYGAPPLGVPPGFQQPGYPLGFPPPPPGVDPYAHYLQGLGAELAGLTGQGLPPDLAAAINDPLLASGAGASLGIPGLGTADGLGLGVPGAAGLYAPPLPPAAAPPLAAPPDVPLPPLPTAPAPPRVSAARVQAQMPDMAAVTPPSMVVAEAPERGADELRADARARFARRMEELSARREQSAFAHQVSVRQGALRRATAEEFADVRRRSAARGRARCVDDHRAATARNRSFFGELGGLEDRVDAALGGRSSAALGLRDATVSVLARAVELAPEADANRRRRRVEELDALERAEAAIAARRVEDDRRSAKDEALDDVVRAKKLAVAEQKLDAARARAAADAQRRANAARDAAVLAALERDAEAAADEAEIRAREDAHAETHGGTGRLWELARRGVLLHFSARSGMKNAKHTQWLITGRTSSNT